MHQQPVSAHNRHRALLEITAGGGRRQPSTPCGHLTHEFERLLRDALIRYWPHVHGLSDPSSTAIYFFWLRVETEYRAVTFSRFGPNDLLGQP